MRIGSEAPKRRTHSFPRHNSHGTTGTRHLEPSSAIRHKRTDWAETVGCLQQPPLHCAGRKTTPSGTTPSRTSRHKAIRSLRAKATIMSLASTARVLGAGSKPLRQRAVLLEHEKSPRQLDHASPNSSIAGTGQPFLPAFCAALVGRASEAGITRYGPSVAHVSRQHLLHRHVRGLDANPDHARQQAHHCVWSITRRLLRRSRRASSIWRI